MLDPLELLRLAGVRKYVELFELLFDGEVFNVVGALDCENSCFRKLLSDVVLVLDDVVAVDEVFPIFLTVFIEAELFSDDRELRKLVRDALRSTSVLLDGLIADGSTLRRNELVLFGMMLFRDCVIGVGVSAARSDRLRVKL